MPAFTVLGLDPPLLQALEVLGFTQMTPVQEHSIPALLAGKDVIAQARTGSGKTVAFGLGLLSRLDVSAGAVQGLVLCPTRELADQVGAELRRLARFVRNVKVVTLAGGVPVRTQTPALEHPPHVVVGTPGRILDHLRRETLDMRALRTLVLDEADRMLDMGFAEEIGDVVSQLPATRQTLLFSATFPDKIRAMSRSLQRAAVEVTVDAAPVSVEIEQTFFEVKPSQRIDALVTLLMARAASSALVFCHTRNDTRDVAAALQEHGYSAQALHGELDQRERDEVLLRFGNGSCTVLVATDVAARGLDVKGLALVISTEPPNDPDIHLHRVGRTGRAGHAGVALTLCGPGERSRVAAIEARQGAPVQWGTVPTQGVHPPVPAPMVTLLIDGGKQDKLRAGDLLGALTGDVGLPGAAIGKIDVQPQRTYVAVARAHADAALAGLNKNKIKAKSFRARLLGGS